MVGTNLLGGGDEGRDRAKTTMYAYVFGAGTEKLGSIVMPRGSLKEKRELGDEIKEKLLTRFEAMGQLQRAIIERVSDRHCLIGLDGRVLRVRKAHAALNTLLQSAGAVAMKQSLVLLDASLKAHGLKFGSDYEFVVNVHDEAQAEVLPEHVPLYRQLALAAIPEAGRRLNVKCPLKAEFALGQSWKDTH